VDIERLQAICNLCIKAYQEQCKHEHTSFQGDFHFVGGEIWDDIMEICNDCGVNLDRYRRNHNKETEMEDNPCDLGDL
jgi:hypothetical protein